MSEHGYVYVFHNESLGWTKIGMTLRADQQACGRRLRHYLKEHALPIEGWAFVCLIATFDPIGLEQRLHRRLRVLRIVHGRAREIFMVSIGLFYEAIMNEERFLLDNSAVLDPEIVRRRAARQAQNLPTPLQRRALQRERRERNAALRAESQAQDRANAAAWQAFYAAMQTWCARPDVVAHYSRKGSFLDLFRGRQIAQEARRIALTQPVLAYPFPQSLGETPCAEAHFQGPYAFYDFRRAPVRFVRDVFEEGLDDRTGRRAEIDA